MGKREVRMPELTVRNPLLDENGAPVSTGGAGYASSMAADPGAGRYRNDVQSFATPNAGGAVAAQDRPSMAADGGQQGVVGDGGAIETVGTNAAPQRPVFDPQQGQHVGMVGQTGSGAIGASSVNTGVNDGGLNGSAETSSEVAGIGAGGTDEGAVRRNPYQWLMDKYAQYRQTPEGAMTQEEIARKEQNKAKIAGMLGLFTGIGNMLVTSSNRFGRAVQSPDFAKPVAEGIASREKQRREDEQLQAERAYKQQQIDLQKQKMSADAEKEKYNRGYKDRQQRHKETMDQKNLDLKAKNYADQMKLKQDTLSQQRDVAEMQEKGRNSRFATQQANQIKMHNEREAGLNRRASNGGGGNSSTIGVSVGNGNVVQIPKNSWNESVARDLYEQAYKEAAAIAKEAGQEDSFFDEKAWGNDASKMTTGELANMLSAYLSEHPESAVADKIKLLTGSPLDVDWVDEGDNEFSLESITNAANGN